MLQVFRHLHTILKNEIYDEFYKADLAFVSVGGNHLPAAAQSVADIINTYGAQKVVKNIIVCENWKDAAETFKKPLMEALNEETVRYLKNMWESQKLY